MILDWDIHHGNGTQNIFYGSNVLYLSLHRYENGTFYPKSEEGNYNYDGRGDGQNFNINVAFNDVSFIILFNNNLYLIIINFKINILI